MKTDLFDVKGMTCSACVAHVEKAVGRLPGIVSVQVNLLTNSMRVRYEENLLDTDRISKSVDQAGYTATLKSKASSSAAFVSGTTDTTGSMPSNGVRKTFKADEETLLMRKRWMTSFVFLIPLLYISMGEMMHLPVPGFISGHENALNFAFLQFLLSIPIYVINKQYFEKGFKSLYRRHPNMDSLIAIGSAAALVYGVFAIFRIGHGLGHQDMEVVKQFTHDLYFESGATILTLITLGKYLEARSKSRTSEALNKLMDLSPKTAVVIRDGQEQEIAIGEVVVGDVVVVKSGQKIPVDGVIVNGNGSVDESALTGESMPVFRSEGDQVMTATLNISGYFTFCATKVGEDTTLAQIIHLVEEASASKAPISKLADKISSVFVPVVIVIAVIATVIWMLLGYPFEFALSIGISVLVISCPCALGLATPVAIMVGTGRGASEGILVKSAEALETGHKINTVVLDKTGTLTAGTPVVTRIVSNRFFSESKLLEIAVSLEKSSEHPLAGAILEEAEFRGVSPLPVENYEMFPGKGIRADINDRPYYAGNLALMEANSIKMGPFPATAAQLADEGNTPLYIANAAEVLGVIAVADVLKATSKDAVQKLQDMGMEVIMLTGDHVKVSEAIQHQLGLRKVIAEVLPHQKEAEIRRLQEEGLNVAMVGDGINDAPSLMRANLGIAIGAGADIAMESADVVLIHNDISGVASFLQLSREVMLNIKQNLFWAFFYNVLGIPLAAGVFYGMLGWKLSPMFAAAAMSLSSVTVVLNALRLAVRRPAQSSKK